MTSYSVLERSFSSSFHFSACRAYDAWAFRWGRHLVRSANSFFSLLKSLKQKNERFGKKTFVSSYTRNETEAITLDRYAEKQRNKHIVECVH
jgi:hypothetical protein